MYSLVIVLVLTPLIHANCNNTSEWFNENSPLDPASNGNDIERFSLIRAKYPWKFDISRWTGQLEIRAVVNESINSNSTPLISKYTQISDGFICHAVNKLRCTDFEIRFCLEYNSCGVSKNPVMEQRIVGGIEARPNSFPWLVSIQLDNRHICGGTLIDDQHVLTAASCFKQSLFPVKYAIVLGAHKLSDAANGTVDVERLVFHSDYNDVTNENDIGLMKLTERIPAASRSVGTACLSQSVKRSSASDSYVIAGWGTTRFSSGLARPTNELRQAKVNVMTECSRVYPNFDARKQICAGTANFSSDACQGDTGGGLFEKRTTDTDRWILTGIVSYGNGCATSGYPSVYVRVSAYYDWIQSSITKMMA